MPDRIIREQAVASPTLARWSDAAERAWWRLTVKVDDYGRFDADPEVLLHRLFERRPSGWTTVKMAQVIQEWQRQDDCIHLYSVAGSERVYGHCLTFQKHQRKRDSKPKFPAPPCGDSPQLAAKCRESRQLAAYSESRESRVESRESSNSSPRGKLPQGAGPEGRMQASEGGTAPERWEQAPWGTPEALVALFNTATPDHCPAVETLSPRRREKARAALRQFPDRAWWEACFREYHRSKFLSGKVPVTEGHRSFKPDFDWLLSNGKDGAENCVKVHDGRYSDG